MSRRIYLRGSSLGIMPGVLLAATALFGAVEPLPAQFDPAQAIRATSAPAPELTETQAQLERALEEESAPLDRARTHIALANWWLSFPAAHAATRLILGMDDQADRSAIAVAAQKAGKHLSEARAILDEQSQPASDKLEKSRRELMANARVLKAFAEVLDKAQTGSQSDADQEAWRKSGRGLAVARESDDEQLAAAALLWQAFAFEQAGDHQRALDSLPDALAQPEQSPYGLIGRLLRCRLIAEAGQAPAAISLLGRMDGQLKSWISSAAQRNHARRLVGLVQYNIVTRWMEELKSSTQPGASDGADTLQPILDEIEQGFTQVKNPEVYFMEPAVPVLVAVETSESPATSASTNPEE